MEGNSMQMLNIDARNPNARTIFNVYQGSLVSHPQCPTSTQLDQCSLPEQLHTTDTNNTLQPIDDL